jgi:hypothetical protein
LEPFVLEALEGTPSTARQSLWYCISILRSSHQRLSLRQPTAVEVLALLDHLHVCSPDVLPLAGHLVASIPAAREIFARWQPPTLSPELAFSWKMLRLFLAFNHEARKTHEEGGGAVGTTSEQVLAISALFELVCDRYPEDVPLSTLQQVDRLIDNPCLSTGEKVNTIVRVLFEWARDTVEIH